MRRFVLIAIVAALLRAPVSAAGHAGRVMFGEVPVPGATVTASKGDRQVTTVTDEQGAFTLGDLEDGTWTIRIEMATFAVLTRDVDVAPATPASAWALALKPLEELVSASQSAQPPPLRPSGTLTATAPSAAPRPTVAASRPATTAAPAATTPAATPATPAEEPSAVTDGYLINGSVNNAAASPIAQSPAFGNNRRSGPSLYSGGFAFVYGGSGLDSRPFTFAGVPTVRPDYQNVRVTATFGGPIRMSRTPIRNPNLFVSFQHSNDHSTTTQPGVVPTPREQKGDFSASRTRAGVPVQIVDPKTGVPFANNAIPTDRLSPQALALLAYYPQPTIDGDGFNFQAPLLSGTVQTLLTTRVTQVIDANTQLVGLFAYQRSTSDQRSMFGFTDQNGVSGADTSVTLTRRLTRTMVMRLRSQFTRVTNRTTPFFANLTNVSGDAGITGNDQSPENWGPPALQFSSLTGLSDASPVFNRSHTSVGGAELSWSHGRHNVTFGGDLRRVTTAVRAQLNPRGTFTFTGAATGSDLADFLLGLPTTSSIAFGNADKDFRALSAAAYISDDWRFRPTLTMQIGARWEFETPMRERLGRLVNLDVAPGFTDVEPVLAGETGPITGRLHPAGLIRPDWSGLQPRIGLAWRPIPASSLIVRGGYGVYRNNGIYQSITTLLSQQPPLSKAFTTSTSPTQPLSLANGFTAPAASAGNTFAVDPDLRAGVSQNWQLLVQRDVFGFLTFSGSYLGTRGTRLLQEFLPNTYPAGATNPCPTCPAGFVYLTSGGRSTRHAGQWQLRWRLHRGLAASFQYTLSKARDNAAAFANVSLSGSAIAQNWLDLDADEARSNFDQRHTAVTQVQYTTGVGAGGGGLLDGKAGRLFGGWTLMTQLSAGSGLPVTPVYLAPVSGTGVTGSVRPSLTGVSLDPIAGRYLNPDAYMAPAAGEWGNAGRNSVNGPTTFNCDFSVTRTFGLTGRMTLDWRIDASNVLNRKTFTGVNLILGGSQFGLPNFANSPRRLVSTTRLRF